MSLHNGMPLPSANDIVSEVFSSLKKYGHLAGQVPSDDYDYHHTFPAFRAHVNTHVSGLIGLMQSCTHILPERRQVTIAPEVSSSGALTLLEKQRELVMDAMDSLLESVDTILDDLRGRKLPAAEQLGVVFGLSLGADTGKVATESGGGCGSTTDRHNHSRHSRHSGLPSVTMSAQLPRPQLAFATPVDNSTSPFTPVYYDATNQRHVGQPGVHPFAEVIRGFHVPYRQLAPHAEHIPVPLCDSALHWVDDVEALHAMVETLREVSELAIDLEHHDYYSYQGFTCLMQISTRTTDYIVDCLRLRAEMHALAPVMLDPQILKVLHGAREDVRWLQKDFGLYLVNFFDTGIALQTLHMPYSLAFAVDHFCQVRLDKKYQTADWRIRPLPAEMIAYARLDTHYLLYIYDRLCALLLNHAGHAAMGSSLLHVYDDSRRLSLELYEKPTMDTAISYKRALGRSLGGLTGAQHEVARAVFNWRDGRAREVDESPQAVMTLASVLTVASKLPSTVSELLRCCHPVSAVTRSRVADLFAVVRCALGMQHEVRPATSTDATCSLDGGQCTDAQPGLHQATTEEDTQPSSNVRRHAAIRYGPVVCAGVHRPMTGTLHSIESVFGLPFRSDAAPAAAGQANSSINDDEKDVRHGAAEVGVLGTSMNQTQQKQETNDRTADTAIGSCYVLTQTQPSLWLQQMRRLSCALAHRPDYTRIVPLPGGQPDSPAANRCSHSGDTTGESRARVEDALVARESDAVPVGSDDELCTARSAIPETSAETSGMVHVLDAEEARREEYSDGSSVAAAVQSASTGVKEGVAVAMRQAYCAPSRKRRRKV